MDRLDQSPPTLIDIPPAVAIPASAAQAELPRRSLSADVARFIGELQGGYPDRIAHRPMAFKRRLLSLIDHGLPPYPKPGGRPPKATVTRATDLFRAQTREVEQGKRKTVNWHLIASDCVSGYGKIRSLDYRRAVVARLRNSVYARLKRKSTHKQKRRSSHQNTPTVY
jgi:hypothetical protein